MEQSFLIKVSPQSNRYIQDEIKETEKMVNDVGSQITKTFIQKRNKPDPKYCVGKGKLTDIGSELKNGDVKLLIFDNILRPSQKSNIENFIFNMTEREVKIVDRIELILDIFSLHASSLDAKVQVELAQLQYVLPRLKGYGKVMSRLGGGIGTRGPGETKLEIDRRKTLKKISSLKRELKNISKRRKLLRKQRVKFKSISIVGYTNAGKTTLLNRLTKSTETVMDQPFTTLTPRIRAAYFKGRGKILVSDTVGFIRNLPPMLISSFSSTLEEINYSDLIITLYDISSGYLEEHLNVVNEILESILRKQKNQLIVFNKTDCQIPIERVLSMKNRFPDSLFISAQTGTNIDQLKLKLTELLF